MVNKCTQVLHDPDIQYTYYYVYMLYRQENSENERHKKGEETGKGYT